VRLRKVSKGGLSQAGRRRREPLADGGPPAMAATDSGVNARDTASMAPATKPENEKRAAGPLVVE
jgi:hypothetical protein